MEVQLEIQNDLIVFAKIFAVALAVGLDVLAVSVAVGIAQVARNTTWRLGFAFASAEITMQVIGYELGARAGELLGQIGAYAGFGLLAIVGVLMIRSSLRDKHEADIKATGGMGLLMTSLSISLDSLGVGVALPGAGIPLLPLLIIISISTMVFTLFGLAFGALLGERWEHSAERVAGIMLVGLAALFAANRLI
jgi:manganese efflux pump family protein